MCNVTDDAINEEHIMDIPPVVEGTQEKDEQREDSMSVKDIEIKVDYSEWYLLLLGLTAIALDPVFFYVPMMNENSTCLGLDKTLMIVLVILRTFVDIIHDWLWWSKSRFSRKERPMGKPVTWVDRIRNLLKWRRRSEISFPKERRYSRSKRAIKKPLTWVGVRNLLKWRRREISSVKERSSVLARVIAILASLPLPQVMVLAVDLQSHLKTWLKYGVICQFVPRILRTYPTYVLIMSFPYAYAWRGAAFNLLLFVCASHTLGGFWYLRAVERKMDCMEKACQNRTACIRASLYCEKGSHADNGFINDICAAQPKSNATIVFDYGIYSDAIKSNLIGSTNFINKLTGGFWWGIRNLSSMAQNLEYSDYIWDTCFTIFICILGLFLFAVLIGNFQMYLQLVAKRNEKSSEKDPALAKLVEEELRRKRLQEEELRIKRLEEEELKQKRLEEIKREQLDQWALIFSLPHHLRKEVSQCQHRKWKEVSEVNLESLFNNIPWEIKKKLKPYFCNKLFYKVKEFEELNSKIKEELQERARPMVFQARTTIHREGYPIYEMIHIVQGKVLIYNNNDVNKGLPANELKRDDFFGDEVLQRAIESPLPKLPLATQTVQSMTKVEAFALSFDDFATTFTRHGRLLEPYKKEWAAHAITSAFKKNTNINKFRKPSQEGK